MRPFLFALVIGSALACVEEPLEDQRAVDDDAPLLPPLGCSPELDGPPLADVTEATPNYPEESAALDTSTIEAIDLATLSGFQLTVTRWMLETDRETLTRDEVLKRGPLGEAVLNAFAAGGGELDFRYLRRGLHANYLCARPIPADLDALRARYGEFKEWTTFDVACSRAKGTRRAIYEHPEGLAFVAETIGAEGELRETEVIFSDLRASGELDFAVYTERGQLTDRSIFATASDEITTSAPYTCLTCHSSFESGRVDRLFPDNGAGCR